MAEISWKWLSSRIRRRWVARIFTVWRTHFRTFTIVSHVLAHRTSVFDNRTRTRTFFYYIVNSQAVDWSSNQFLTIFGVLLIKTFYYLRLAIKGCMNSFQYLWITWYIYFSCNNVWSSRILIRLLNLCLWKCICMKKKRKKKKKK